MEETKTILAESAQENAVQEVTEARYVAPKRRRRFGDRKDGRRLRTIQPMPRLMPFILRTRNDACNQFTDSFDVTEADKYCRQKIREGCTNFNFMYLLIAAYVRAASQYPAINRYVSGQRIYARNEISVVMTIKKSMKLEEPDTCIRVAFAPDDTAAEVYEKFERVIQMNQADADSKNDFDKIMDFFVKLPRFLINGIVDIIKLFDYFGTVLLPDLPFYGSMIITSMGSLGIPPIYHHIYNFGNLPIFFAFGKKYYKLCMDNEGNITKRRHIDLKVVTDERICDGFYYASAFKYIKKLIEHPEMLDERPAQVVEDID